MCPDDPGPAQQTGSLGDAPKTQPTGTSKQQPGQESTMSKIKDALHMKK